MRECYNKQLGSDKGVTIALGEEGSPLPRVHINRSWVEVSHQIHPIIGVSQTDPFTGFYHGNKKTALMLEKKQIEAGNCKSYCE